MILTKPTVRPTLHRPGFINETLRTLLFVFVVTVLFDMAIPRSLVDGRSMQPTFVDGERLIVSRLNYMFELPERGDIVVFNSMNPAEVGVMLIKRVIGIPGDTIEFRDQQLFINGVLVNEPYIQEVCSRSSCRDNTWQLGDDEYFAMGDNRNASHDSRAFGVVPISHIVGRVIFRYWPINRIGPINHFDYPEFP